MLLQNSFQNRNSKPKTFQIGVQTYIMECQLNGMNQEHMSLKLLGRGAMAGTDFGGLARKIRGGESVTVREMKNTPPEIVVTRQVNRRGLVGNISVLRTIVKVLNARHIVVFLNGQVVGSLEEGESIKFKGVEGENAIGVGAGSSIQRRLFLNLENGTRHRLFCGREGGSVKLVLSR